MASIKMFPCFSYDMERGKIPILKVLYFCQTIQWHLKPKSKFHQICFTDTQPLRHVAKVNIILSALWPKKNNRRTWRGCIYTSQWKTCVIWEGLCHYHRRQFNLDAPFFMVPHCMNVAGWVDHSKQNTWIYAWLGYVAMQLWHSYWTSSEK